MSFTLTTRSLVLGMALSMAPWTFPEAGEMRFSYAPSHAGGITVIASTDETFPAEKLASLKSFSVYALSRGSGVPEAASELILELRSRYQANGAQKEVSEFIDDRIGLEGETRICIKFASASAAQTAWKDVQVLIGSKELIDLRAEECVARSRKTPI